MQGRGAIAPCLLVLLRASPEKAEMRAARSAARPELTPRRSAVLTTGLFSVPGTLPRLEPRPGARLRVLQGAAVPRLFRLLVLLGV